MTYADVIVDITAKALDRPFQYLVPEELEPEVEEGAVVEAPFGNGNRQITGYVMALESILSTLREYRPSRIVCVFGCGGNRARSRRYEMGEVSGRHADFTILTSDNPRYENPEAILDDIETGIRRTKGKYIRIADRREAIAYSIHNGQPGDVIVLAGKGHEDYQEICGKKYPMDERVIIAEILAEDAKKGN